MLLQRALQAAKVLQAAPLPQGEAASVLEAAHLAASSVGAFQELLDQLLNHWQVGHHLAPCCFACGHNDCDDAGVNRYYYSIER